MKPPIKEEQVQRSVIDGLTALGYAVLQTTVRGVHKGYGSSKGVPDLLVTRNCWPEGLWLGIEIKGPKTALSAEQKQLLEAGRIFIARDWETARQIVDEQTKIFTRTGH